MKLSDDDEVYSRKVLMKVPFTAEGVFAEGTSLMKQTINITSD